jgi:hypothetical protein
METLCCFLLGPNGNQGYSFIGRFTQLSKEEMVENGK